MNIPIVSLVLEPTPIDRRRMIRVDNLSLVQSTLNDRNLLDLNLFLETTRHTAAPQSHHHDTHHQSHSYSGDIWPPKMQLPSKQQLLPQNDKDLSPLLMTTAVSHKKPAMIQQLEQSPAPKTKMLLADKLDGLSQIQIPDNAPDDPSISNNNASDSLVFKSSQMVQWNDRYQELIQFKKKKNHCRVPLHYSQNSSLAHWVKRQRHQYRMKKEGKHSTLTDERQAILEEVGFVWSSHKSAWDDKWNQLKQFKEEHGHSKVPKNYPSNQSLAIWVKCQRRQFKMYIQGTPSNMSPERIEKLNFLDFVFYPRASVGKHQTY